MLQSEIITQNKVGKFVKSYVNVYRFNKHLERFSQQHKELFNEMLKQAEVQKQNNPVNNMYVFKQKQPQANKLFNFVTSIITGY